jgi:hypothetical protein
VFAECDESLSFVKFFCLFLTVMLQLLILFII